MDPYGLQGHSCLTMGCTRGCKGIPALAPGAAPAPPSALTLVTAELLLSHILTALSIYNSTGFSLPFPNSVIPEALPLSLLGSALASRGSALESVTLALLDTGEASGCFSQNPSLWTLVTKAMLNKPAKVTFGHLGADWQKDMK
ncbi:hypothetical protein TURU_149947 [Turdus rufiventris]|nr:hypothetical protein TURU_149947 [Turdus rufiventris]